MSAHWPVNQGEAFHGKEIRPHQNFHVCTDKISPANHLLAHGRRREAMPTENVPHRLIREPVTQVGHGTHDPFIAPPGLFLCHFHDHPLYFFIPPPTPSYP